MSFQTHRGGGGSSNSPPSDINNESDLAKHVFHVIEIHEPDNHIGVKVWNIPMNFLIQFKTLEEFDHFLDQLSRIRARATLVHQVTDFAHRN